MQNFSSEIREVLLLVSRKMSLKELSFAIDVAKRLTTTCSGHKLQKLPFRSFPEILERSMTKYRSFCPYRPLSPRMEGNAITFIPPVSSLHYRRLLQVSLTYIKDNKVPWYEIITSKNCPARVPSIALN